MGAPGGRPGPAEIIRDPPRFHACGPAGQNIRSPSPSGSPSFCESLRVSPRELAFLRESSPRELPETVPGVGPPRGARLCRLQQEGAARRLLLQRGLPAAAGPPRPAEERHRPGFSLAWSLAHCRIPHLQHVDGRHDEAAPLPRRPRGGRARGAASARCEHRCGADAHSRGREGAPPQMLGITLPPRAPAARRLDPPVFARGCECTAASCSCTPPSWHPHAEPAPPALRWLSSQPHLSRDAVHTHAVGAAPSRGAQLARRRHHHRL